MQGTSEAHILTDPIASAACPKCAAMLDIEGLPAFTAVQCPSCEFEFQVPARFGNFVLLQLLGAGGMGGVYRARDEGLNREVAIKVMLKSLGDDPQFVATFQREAQAAAKLNHPHIAQIYAFGQERGQPYIAMELVSGGSLDKMMSAQGPMDPAAVIHIGRQIAEGLREAADAGLVHGDVKPENILFDNDKNAKLVDFGLAAMSSGPGNDVWGTPYYIAPEKVRRQKSDFRSDIYSLGATLYHAITGVPPFDGEDATAVVKARFDGPPKKMSDICGKVPEEVDALIMRMLQVEPQTRYPTYGSLLGDMRRYLSKAGPVNLATASKKIMIKGKYKTTAGMASMTGDLGELPPGMVPVDQIEEKLESEEAAGKRGCKMGALIVVGIGMLVLLLAGGIFGGLHYTKVKKEKAEKALIATTQAKAYASIANSLNKAKTIVERIRAVAPEALTYAKAGADAVVAVLGEGVRSSMVPPEPEYALPQQQAATPDATTNAVASQTAAGSTNGVAATTHAVTATTNAVTAATNAVPKTVTPSAPSNEVPKTAAPPTAEQPPAAADETAPKEGDAHPVVAIVRGMFMDAYAVKAGVLLADALLAELEAQAKSAEALASPEKANDLVKLANAMVEKVNSLSYIKELNDVPRKVSQLKKTLESVKIDAASLAEMKKLEAAEQEKKRKAEEAAEKKRLEKEAHQQMVAEEQEKVAAAELENMDALKNLQFREAIGVLKVLKEELTTDEAKVTLAVALDRVNRLKEFHAFLVEKVKGFKSARGWAVDGADLKTLSVGGIKIPWVDVYTKRPEIIGEFINELVRSEKAIQSMKLSERAKAMTHAALCLNLFYKDVPSAQELAKQLALSAAQQFDVEADTIKQLLPHFFTE